MNPPDLKSNTSGPENRAKTLVWRAVASKVLVWKPNGDGGDRKKGVPDANGRLVLYKKSATTAPPRMSWKSPSPVLTVILWARASTLALTSSIVGAGGGVALAVGGNAFISTAGMGCGFVGAGP